MLWLCCREVLVVRQLYNGPFREQGWANTMDFKPLLKWALNPQASFTAFFPSDDSWPRVAAYYCLSLQGVLDNISNLPEMLANYLKAHIVPNVIMYSKDFKDGMVLTTMLQASDRYLDLPSLSHRLQRTQM